MVWLRGRSMALSPPKRLSHLRVVTGPTYNPSCFLGRHGLYSVGDMASLMPACEGRLIRAHIIPQRVLKQHLPSHEIPNLLWSPAVWVWACGGSMGNAGHHGALDSSRALRLPRAAIPARTEVFAARWNLTWWLDVEYGVK